VTVNVAGKTLYQTVLNVSMRLFFDEPILPAERDALVGWILAHQNRQRGFCFCPTVAEREQGIRLFTGEKLQTRLAADNAVEMETLRLLALLQPDTPQVQQLFEMSERRLSAVCYGRVCSKGECAHASISVLRYHTVRGAGNNAGMIGRGLDALRQDRTGKGHWRTFPFYYTLLWLTELHNGAVDNGLDQQACAELSYARDGCKRLLSRPQPGSLEEPFVRVRAKILHDALAQVRATAPLHDSLLAPAAERTC
jgi:hypothetical protein